MANTNVIEGTQGSVALPTGHNAKLNYFSAAIGMGIIDVTGFDSAGWAEFLGTIKSLSGSARGRMKYNAASTTPGWDATSKVGATMTLTFITGCTLTFIGIVSGISASEDAHGEAEITFNFMSTGPVTPVWDETP